MANPKSKPQSSRVAGAKRFSLPDRPQRVVEQNPLRDILQEARAQESALVETPKTTPVIDIAGVPDKANKETKALELKEKTPVRKIAEVSNKLTEFKERTLIAEDTPAAKIAGVSRAQVAQERPVIGKSSFSEFKNRWAPILRPGQMKICEVLFEMTHSLGLEECFTSMPKLAQAAGLKERQCYNVVSQLEALGFITRPEIYNTPTKKGTVFRLYLMPQLGVTNVGRRYHIGGDDIEDL